jgi:hypothetical protein
MKLQWTAPVLTANLLQVTDTSLNSRPWRGFAAESVRQNRPERRCSRIRRRSVETTAPRRFAGVVVSCCSRIRFVADFRRGHELRSTFSGQRLRRIAVAGLFSLRRNCQLAILIRAVHSAVVGSEWSDMTTTRGRVLTVSR